MQCWSQGFMARKQGQRLEIGPVGLGLSLRTTTLLQ